MDPKQISPIGDSATLINQTSYQGVWLRPCCNISESWLATKSQVTNNLPLLRLQWHCTRRTLESITWCWLWENIGRVAMLRSPHPMTNKSCQAGEVSPWPRAPWRHLHRLLCALIGLVAGSQWLDCRMASRKGFKLVETTVSAPAEPFVNPSHQQAMSF